MFHLKRDSFFFESLKLVSSTVSFVSHLSLLHMLCSQLYNSNQVGREEVETSWIGSFNASSGNAQRRHGSSCDHTTLICQINVLA